MTYVVEKGERLVIPADGTWTEDVVVPDDHECEIVGETAGPWNSILRGALTVERARVVIRGLTCYDLHLRSPYQSEVRSTWVDGSAQNGRLQIGEADWPASRLPSCLTLDGVHQVYGQAPRILGADIQWRGSAERWSGEMIVGHDLQPEPISLCVRVEQDVIRRVVCRGARGTWAGSAFVVADLVIERGEWITEPVTFYGGGGLHDETRSWWGW